MTEKACWAADQEKWYFTPGDTGTADAPSCSNLRHAHHYAEGLATHQRQCRCAPVLFDATVLTLRCVCRFYADADEVREDRGAHMLGKPHWIKSGNVSAKCQISHAALYAPLILDSACMCDTFINAGSMVPRGRPRHGTSRRGGERRVLLLHLARPCVQLQSISSEVSWQQLPASVLMPCLIPV